MGDERQYRDPLARKAPAQPVPASKPLAPLTPEQKERVSQARADMYALFPELVPMIKGLSDAGMIDGWRAVTITRNE